MTLDAGTAAAVRNAVKMKARTARLLTDLGGNLDEVAATLGRLGIRGVPGKPDRCPVARYLQANDIRVSYVSSLHAELGNPRSGVEVLMPDPAAEFICDFDETPQRYPNLIEDESAQDGAAVELFGEYARPNFPTGRGA